MALDGITVAAIAAELRGLLLGGRISKLTQPEADEILMTVKGSDGQYRLVLSADPSLPLVYLTEQNKPSPLTAPSFLMLLRKHLQGGHITAITQPGLERVIRLEAEHLDEMGDKRRKALVLELMGKHSNLIFLDEEDRIIDAIRRVPAGVSSVREVLPGRPYFIPNTRDKLSPLDIPAEEFRGMLKGMTGPVEKALNEGLTGISPLIARETVLRAGLDGTEAAAELPAEAAEKLHAALQAVLEPVKTGAFAPTVYVRKNRLLEYAPFPLELFREEESRGYPRMSEAMEAFYGEKSAATRIRQRSADLRHILQLAMDRTSKKLELQRKQLKDTEKRGKYKLWGELIQAFGYQLEPGTPELVCENYYDDNKEIRIPLETELTPQENAKKYFDRYQKLKRTFEATSRQAEESAAELEYLRSVEAALSRAESEEDLTGIKAELVETGWIRRKSAPKGKGEKAPKAGKPLHFVSSDGFDIYVGRNNLQNEELSFKLASGGDWWFHVKGIPGSHVIVKTEGQELPDRCFEEAAALAAWYSSASRDSKTEVDYTLKKNLKKPALYQPGMVIYHSNYSMTVMPSQCGLTAR